MTAEQVLGGALPSFLTSYVKGGERGGGRMLTITAPPLELKKILQFIEALDKPQNR